MVRLFAMSLADDIIDRQRLRRKLGFWRIAAIIAVLIVLAIAANAVWRSGADGSIGRDHIAHVTISGAITGSSSVLERLERIAGNENVKAMILTMDSPGGTTAGGEAIYEAVRRIAEKKPVVTQVDTLAASAGYMIAAASDHIIARQTSIVGSIGVIFQYPKLDGLLETLGVEMRAIKSTPLKAEPNFYGETPPEAEQAIRAMILDSYDWFKDLVAERRGFDAATITELADGSVWTGRQGLENGLVDALGGLSAAEDWAKQQDGVSDDLPVIEWKEQPVGWAAVSGANALRWLAEATGLDIAIAGLPRHLRDRVFLDGLLSLWHVGENG